MTTTEIPLMTVVKDPRRSSSSSVFPDQNRHLARLRDDIATARAAGDFTALGEVLNPDTDWQGPAAVCIDAISQRLVKGEWLYVSLPNRLVEPVYNNEAIHALVRTYVFLRPGDHHDLLVAGDAVTAIRGRAYKERSYTGRGYDETPRAVVDMRIKTDIDQPILTITRDPEDGHRKLQEVESGGQWFSFPLGRGVSLDLIS